MDKVRHMAAGAVQHVVGRTVVGASGHCEREEAEDETRGSRGSSAKRQRIGCCRRPSKRVGFISCMRRASEPAAFIALEGAGRAARRRPMGKRARALRWRRRALGA